jgi:hypothetical protein
MGFGKLVSGFGAPWRWSRLGWDLRHSCASLAVSSGANVLAVSRMLGHKDPSITLRIYADLFDSDLDAVAVNLDAKIASSVQSVSKAPADRRRNRRPAPV